MALKLSLLSGEAVENMDLENFEKFKIKLKKKKFKLTEEQTNSLNEINNKNEKFRVHVLQGTTGSGKTIVYFEALKRIINKSFQGLIMLPEIGLTSQFEKKFIEFFGFKPAIWHSGVSKKKRK